jgi:hypothetical protein
MDIRSWLKRSSVQRSTFKCGAVLQYYCSQGKGANGHRQCPPIPSRPRRKRLCPRLPLSTKYVSSPLFTVGGRLDLVLPSRQIREITASLSQSPIPSASTRSRLKRGSIRSVSNYPSGRQRWCAAYAPVYILTTGRPDIILRVDPNLVLHFSNFTTFKPRTGAFMPLLSNNKGGEANRR